MKAVVPFLLLLGFAVIPNADGATFQGARVSAVIQDVRVLTSNAAPRQAVVNDKIGEGTAVRTGAQSRAELTFADLTITRLGENTVFSLNQAAREIHVDHGSVLLEVPPKSAAARITSAAITAAVQGGTALFGTGPPTKFLVLEGIGTFYPVGHPEEAVTLHGGEMVMLTADGHVTKPQQFDVKAVVETSALIVDFPDLANLPLILAVVDQQQADQSLTGSASPAQSPPSEDIIDVISVNTTANPAVTQTSSPPPLPTPSESGTPSVISSPNPYVITNRTTIKTDTSITTNGRTDFGKIYNGPTQDGPFTLWAFGSTSAFDTTAVKLDTGFFADPNNLPIAVFKFQSLLITGDPTIDTTNGVTRLGLIGVDSITTGPPGGTLTFAGLDLLALATVDGPINLTSDVSFQGLSVLAFYARGAGSDLTINSPISSIGDLKMAAENSIELTNPGTMSVGQFDATAGNNFSIQIGGALSLNGKVRLETFVLPGATLASGANFTLNVGSDYTNSSSTDFSRLRVMNEGHIGTGGNVSVDITGNLTAAGFGSATAFPEPGDVEALVQNTNAQIDSGGNLTFRVGSNVNVNGLAFYVQNYDETMNPAGHIGTGGNIDVQIAGNLNATSYIDVFLNNRGGGTITSGGNLTFNVSGALTIGADAGGFGLAGISSEFTISNRYDDSGGNTTPSQIGSSVALYLHAASISMAGDLFGTGISNRGGSTINGNATATWDVTGNLTIQGTAGSSQSFSDADWFILNDAVHDADAQLTSPTGGTINGNAILTLTVGGDTNIAGDAFFEIGNQRDAASTAPNGGSIIGNAVININAANFSVGGELDVDIFNQKGGSATGSGGSITGNAAINLNVPGNFAMPGTDTNSSGEPGSAFFEILNFRSGPSGSGGFIGGDASVTIQAGSIGSMATPVADFEALVGNSNGGTINGNATVQIGTTGDMTTNSLFVRINNANGGVIGGNAAINMNVGGTATVTNDATIQILGSNPAGSAAINFNGGAYSIGGTFLNTIDGNGTITFTNTDIHANVVQAGVFGPNGSLIIGGSGSNTISADTLLKLYAPGSNGLLKFVANVTLSSGTAMDLAANTITINSGVTVTIAGAGGAANIYTNNANYSGFGGTNPSNGTFGGNGANSPQPLPSAPPFSDPPSSPSSSRTTSVSNQTSSSGNVASSTKTASGTINVSDSAQLLSLLDTAKPGPNGLITIPAPKSTSNSGNSSGSNLRSRSKTVPAAVNPQLKRDRETIRTPVNDPQPIARAPSA